jgi:hypothetical protein
MATKELDPGQQHTFALAPLRVQLTGTFSAGVVLRAVDQAGDESPHTTVRLTESEMVLTPQPRRVRLVASPAGGSFAAGTTLGLMVRTEGANVAADQVMVAPFDVGALESREIAVIEFAEGRSVLSVLAAPGGRSPVVAAPPVAAQPDGGLASAQAAPVTSAPAASGTPRAGSRNDLLGDDDQLPWLQAGRYAFRDADKVAGAGPGPEAAVSSWGIVLDGSASMRRLWSDGHLDDLITLVAGIAVEWTRTWPGAAIAAGVNVANNPSALRDPGALLAAGFGALEPSSWSSLATGVEQALGLVGRDGFVLVVTDGVPGDVERLAALASAVPQARIGVVTVGCSGYGLPSDGPCEWWSEELAGLEDLAALPNVRVAAVQRRDDGSLNLSERRPAELALALTGPARRGAPV